MQENSEFVQSQIQNVNEQVSSVKADVEEINLTKEASEQLYQESLWEKYGNKAVKERRNNLEERNREIEDKKKQIIEKQKQDDMFKRFKNKQ